MEEEWKLTGIKERFMLGPGMSLPSTAFPHIGRGTHQTCSAVRSPTDPGAIGSIIVLVEMKKPITGVRIIIVGSSLSFVEKEGQVAAPKEERRREGSIFQKMRRFYLKRTQ